jgi:hypothetical protein
MLSTAWGFRRAWNARGMTTRATSKAQFNTRFISLVILSNTRNTEQRGLTKEFWRRGWGCLSLPRSSSRSAATAAAWRVGERKTRSCSEDVGHHHGTVHDTMLICAFCRIVRKHDSAGAEGSALLLLGVVERTATRLGIASNRWRVDDVLLRTARE